MRSTRTCMMAVLATGAVIAAAEPGRAQDEGSVTVAVLWSDDTGTTVLPSPEDWVMDVLGTVVEIDGHDTVRRAVDGSARCNGIDLEGFSFWTGVAMGPEDTSSSQGMHLVSSVSVYASDLALGETLTDQGSCGVAWDETLGTIDTNCTFTGAGTPCTARLTVHTSSAYH